MAVVNVAANYTVNVDFYANGGDTVPTNQSKTVSSSATNVNVSLNITSVLPTWTGHDFVGYAYSTDGAVVKYPNDGIGSSFSRTYTNETYDPLTDTTYKYAQNKSYTYRLYAIWQLQTFTVTYNANGGTNAPEPQTKQYGTDLTITSSVPTRENYIFQGWATSSTGAVVYQSGDSYTNEESVTLYAVWKVAAGVLTSVTDTAIGSTGAATWTKVSNTHTYQLVLSLAGATNVTVNASAGATTASFTIPSGWLAAMPNSTTATATAVLYSYDSGTLVGSTQLPFTVTVPASVKPTISVFTATPHSANATAEGWHVAVQGYSYITLSVTASAGTGATVSNITFSGHGISQSSTATTGNTAIVTSTGSQGYNVTVTDSRGRTSTQTVNVTVYEYANPNISSMQAVRCLSNGTVSDTEGDYIKVLPVFVFSPVNGNNSLTVNKVEYKIHDVSTWTVGATSLVSNAWSPVFGPADITKTFDVRFTITDALGNTFALETIVPCVVGFSFGLMNDRARFGGVVRQPGLEVDWDTTFDGDVTILGELKNKFMKSLWSSSSGWNSGSITVTGLSNYNLFLVRVDTYAVSVLCTLGRTNLTSDPAYFRGMGGYTSSGTNAVNIYVNATRSGDQLTWVNAYSVNTAGTFSARKVIEIIGII